ncbi:MAG TPA: response regulator, partial [Candidatus Acidoferrum sp.]|nr:response regulator [Candidatus Acidoferrum sp.]
MLTLILDSLTTFLILLAAGILLYFLMRGASRFCKRENFSSELSEGEMRKVLVVGDEPLVVDALRELLSRWGYAVSTAADAAEAVRQVEGARPHVILLDLELPGMSGLQILQRLREIVP